MQDMSYKDYLNKWFVDDDITLNKRNTDTTLRDALLLLGSVHYPIPDVKQALKIFMPRVSKVDRTQIRYYHNSNDYLRNKESRTRPGRVALKLFPKLTQTQVDNFNMWYNKYIVNNQQNWTLVIGNTREDFVESFTHIGKSSNESSLVNNYKDMHNSCMRYPFDNLPDHPAAAYATEDFEVWYILGEDDKVYARTIVRVDGQVKSYYTTYGCNSSAVETLHCALKECKVDCSRYAFNGARLKIISKYNEYFQRYTCSIPYVDAVRTFKIDRDNGYFILSEREDDYRTPSDGVYYFKLEQLNFLGAATHNG